MEGIIVVIGILIIYGIGAGGYFLAMGWETKSYHVSKFDKKDRHKRKK